MTSYRLAAFSAVVAGSLMACGGVPDGSEPVAQESAAATVAVRIFIAGDSTVMTYAANDIHQAGWGQYLASYFKNTVAVDNEAIGGRTSRRFIEEGRLTTILASMQAGDYLFVQFGTNDSNKTATYSDGEPYYLAPDTDFKTYIQKYIDGAKSKGGTAVLVSPPNRNTCTNGTFAYSMSAYETAMKELGQANGVPVIALGTKTVAYLNAKNSCAWASANFYLNRADGTIDGTHFQENGANILASLIAGGVSELKLPLAAYLASAPTYYSLSVNSSGSGSTSPAAGTYSYASGTQVTVTATPASGSLFTGWSGAASGTTNPVTITMDGGKTLTANFAAQSYSLTLNVSGNGSTSPAAGTYSYTSGTQVMVTATPASGYAFTGWSGAASGTSNPVTITMNGNKALTANFALVNYTLTVNNAWGGSTSPAAGSYSFASGTQVMVTATPSSGYVFAGWSGAAGGTNNPVTITMDGNKELTANFAAAKDITPPSVPSNLSWGSDGMTVTLSWGASTDDTGVAGYDLYFGSFFLGTFQETSLALIGFKSGTPYNFTVKARDAAGNVSVASNQTTVLLIINQIDTTPPSTPKNLAATSVMSTSVSLSWTASTDDVGVVVYQVYRDGVVAATVTSTKANMTGLSMGTSFGFAVTAIDAAGNVSPQSTPLTVMTAAP